MESRQEGTYSLMVEVEYFYAALTLALFYTRVHRLIQSFQSHPDLRGDDNPLVLTHHRQFPNPTMSASPH